MAEKKIPMRQCIGCREMKSKSEMIRILKTADTGEIVVDAAGKKNGRGAYICRDLECFKKAVKSKAIERSLKCSIPPEVYDKLGEELNSIG
ncbi:MAG: YlxR family protein [Lachnospiraceae bacterium]|nr:YlxR family protein [Lachnospiraceae bacterium]